VGIVDTNTAVWEIVSGIACENGIVGLPTGVAVAVSETTPGVTIPPLTVACRANVPGDTVVTCAFGDAEVMAKAGAPLPAIVKPAASRACTITDCDCGP
jgi:hypothetical protein